MDDERSSFSVFNGEKNTIQLKCLQLFLIYINRMYISYTQERSMMGKVRNVMFRGLVVNAATEHNVGGRTVSCRRDGWIVAGFQTKLFAHKQYEFMSAGRVQVDVQIANENDRYLVITSPFHNIHYN